MNWDNRFGPYTDGAQSVCGRNSGLEVLVRKPPIYYLDTLYDPINASEKVHIALQAVFIVLNCV
jgi:hypothetical protein